MSQSDSDSNGAIQYSPLLYPCQTANGLFDDVYDEFQQTKPHWQPIFAHFSIIKEARVEDLQRRAQRILRDDGATYDLQNDPLTPSVWSLDIIPNVIDLNEWTRLKKAWFSAQSCSTLF